jgi:Holliday junction resolvase RusA-like endonuclease
MINITIPLRAFSKKNSRRIFRRRWGGITNLPSTAYSRFETECWEYLEKYVGAITGPFLMGLVYEVPGKGNVDLDNIVTGVLDALQHYQVIANDRDYVGTDYQRKIIAAKNWCVKISLIPLE